MPWYQSTVEVAPTRREYHKHRHTTGRKKDKEDNKARAGRVEAREAREEGRSATLITTSYRAGSAIAGARAPQYRGAGKWARRVGKSRGRSGRVQPGAPITPDLIAAGTIVQSAAEVGPLLAASYGGASSTTAQPFTESREERRRRRLEQLSRQQEHN